MRFLHWSRIHQLTAFTAKGSSRNVHFAFPVARKYTPEWPARHFFAFGPRPESSHRVKMKSRQAARADSLVHSTGLSRQGVCPDNFTREIRVGICLDFFANDFQGIADFTI
jgi:hypothetical protein